MSAKGYKGLQEAYNSIYEALSDQSELDKLRKASAQATMAGPSKEAQALMSDRTKRILGPEKLAAGIAGQERVQRMMSGAPEPTSIPKPTAPAPTSTTAPVPTPKPATTVKPGDFGTTMGPGPTFRGGPVPPPIQDRTVIKPTNWSSVKNPIPQQPQPPKAPVPDRTKDYQRAWDNRNNPFAKGKIQDAWSKMSPEEKAAAKEWAKANNKNWKEMNLPEQIDATKYGGPENLLKKIIKDKKYGGEVIPLSPTKSANISKNVKEEYTVYDEILGYLLGEGCTLSESNYIMAYVVEQGMHPQEIVARGIANILGLDRPHPTEVFARGLKKMLYPNKPVEVKAPKPPAMKPASIATKPNPYRPGATIRATGPNLDKFPELQRFADQGRRIAEPVAKTAGALATLRNVTPYGVAAAVMAPRPTGDATLTAAMKRGDVAPPAPKLPAPEKPKPVVRTVAQKPKASKPKAVVAPKPEVKGPQWPPLTPPPPVEKKPSLADTVKDIRGAIERSKERQKMDANK